MAKKKDNFDKIGTMIETSKEALSAILDGAGHIAKGAKKFYSGVVIEARKSKKKVKRSTKEKN